MVRRFAKPKRSNEREHVMNSVPCPGCGLPRQAEQVGVVPCPVCEYGSRGPDLVADVPPPAPPRELATPPRKPMPITPIAFAAGVVAGVQR